MWFDAHAILHGTHAASFAKGLQIFRNQGVLDCAIEPDEALPVTGWTVSGRVQVTQREPYDVRVQLLTQPDERTPVQWMGLCSCPVGVQCKHAVALLIKAAYKGRAVPTAGRRMQRALGPAGAVR